MTGFLRSWGAGGRLLVALVAAAAVFGLVTAVQASIPDGTGTIHGCYTKNHGDLRVIDTDKGQACKSGPSEHGEKALDWAGSGPVDAATLNGRSADEIVRVALGHGGSLVTAVSFTQQTTVDITAPTDGFIHLTGVISVDSISGGDTTCNPCRARIRLRDTGTSDTSPIEIATFGDGTHEEGTELTMTWVFKVSAGAQTFALDANQSGSSGTIFFDNPTLTAIFIPFGSTGTGTLGASSPSAPTTSRNG